MTVSSYFLFCKMAKLNLDDLKFMTIGMCLDHIQEYGEMINPSSKEDAIREATQSDFDAF